MRSLPRAQTLFAVILLASCLEITFGAHAAHAETIYVSPPSATVSSGQAFSEKILVSSSQSINAVSGTLTFPADKLQVTGISKNNSIMSLWVQEPSFSNTAGTVDFAGVVLNPGWSGSSGTVITVLFKAVGSGSAKLAVSSGSMLANDGSGTNVLTSSSGATISVAEGSSAPEKPAAAPKKSLLAITSSSHPSQSKWYTTSTGAFAFDYPSEASELKLSLDQNPSGKPTQSYSPPITTKTISNLTEGVSYLHAEYKDAGGWSSTVSYRLNVDRTPPSPFTIADASGRDASLARAQLAVSATDITSFIDHYELSIDGSDYVTWKDSSNGIYTTPVLLSGKHTISGRAVDAAGNIAYASFDFDIRGVSAPTITNYTRQTARTGTVVVEGRAGAGDTVRLYVYNSNDRPVRVAEALSNSDGTFAFGWQPSASTPDLGSDGLHTLVVYAFDGDGHVSDPSAKVPVQIGASFVSRLGQSALAILAMIAVSIALLVTILLLVLHAIRKVRDFKKELDSEARKAQTIIHAAFDILREDVSDYVKMLERVNETRELTREEKSMVRRMKQNLSDAEKAIEREVLTIEKKASSRRK